MVTHQISASVKIVEFRDRFGAEFYVYQSDKLIRVCPSIGMAREIAAGL